MSATERHQSCEARIAEELKSADDYIADTYRKMDRASEAGNYREQEELEESITPYAAEVVRTLRLTLSGGGPASWLDIELERGTNEPVRVEYHFADWFDHAQTPVTEDEAPGLWRLAEYYAEVVEV
ncbi:hypothetical protein QF026_004804 [Streptomyces aurantiacus]|uniref:hypothetical protein n=1 Tax=Streptomyces aurantiacus TaxID=47760 RepID=UPI0027935226|nr:hypothetical protein [Streptomyces aurantiacus]MDQ0776338.1 hypothetical protein [Streptomyces aurantiacus]